MTVSSTNPSWVMTYDNLTSTVLEYLEREDAAVVNALPSFITLAEFQIAEQMKSLGQLQFVTVQLSANNPILAKPARWRKTTSMTITTSSGSQPVYDRRLEYCQNYWPNPTETDTPLYYADADYDHWYFAPTPDQAYTVQVLYYERIAPLSSSNQTNWLTRNAPNAMLYGTLLQAMPFLKNDQRTIFQQMYTQAIQDLKAEDTLRIADRQAVAQDS